MEKKGCIVISSAWFVNYMIDPFERGKVWFIYSKLEREFIETTSYVALETVHEDVWSEKFGELLIRIGSSVGSFFNLMVDSKSLEKEGSVKKLRERIEKIRQKREMKEKKGKKKSEWSPSITNFRKAFNPVFQLSSVAVEASYGLTYYGRLQPFKGFERKAPNWWESHNKLKHEFFEKLEERARLQNTINALAALFVLNILHKESQEYLIKYQNVIVCDYMKSMSKTNILGFFEASKIGVPKTVSGYNFRAVTPLFTHIFRVDEQAGAVSKYIISPD